MSWTRRRFVTATGTAIAAAGLPGIARSVESADVVIVGGGFAGLKAAITLADEGAKVLVLEANSRVGGRAFTADHIEGRPEFGASQIGPFYARVRDMATRLDVALAPGANINAPYTYSIGGQLIPKQDWESSPLNQTVGPERAVLPSALRSFYLGKSNPLTQVDEWLDPEAARYDIPLGKWLNDQGASPAALHLINEGLVGLDIWSESLLTMLQEMTRSRMGMSLVKDTGSKDRFERFAQVSHRVVGGTSRLPEAMAAYLGDRVRLNQVVARITMSADGVELTCQDGNRYHSDFAISALPFKPLERISIEPRLTGNQSAAVRLMPYANNTQVHMRLKGSPYWEQDGLDASLWTDGPLTLVRQPLAYDGSRERLIALVTGRKGERLDQLDPVSRSAFVVDEIERIRPSTKGKLEVVGVHSWRQYPYVSGCRHTYAPGQMTKFMHDMIKPHHHLHFAGEHTRRLEIGMESAMESGERTAIEILTL